MSTPSSYRAPASSSADTNWLDPDASSVTVPPRTAPVPDTEYGIRPVPPSSICTPSARSASRMTPIGRSRAYSSPSNATTPSASAATGGTNRITVPARPQSTSAGPLSEPGVTVTVVPLSLMPTPRDTSADRMREVSRAVSRPVRCDGQSARAARMSARLLIDFDPGTVTRPETAPSARGAGHPCSLMHLPQLRYLQP